MKVINGSAADDVGLDVDKPNAGVENVRGKGVTQVPMKVMVVDVQEVSDGLASKEIPLKPSFRDMVTDVESDNFDYSISGLLEVRHDKGFDSLDSGLLEQWPIHDIWLSALMAMKVIGPGETGMLDERLQRINASREYVHLVADCPLDLEDMFSANHLQSLGDLTLIVPVLRTKYWPTLLKISYNQSAKMLTLGEKFRSYYLGTHTSGRLTWQINMGTVAKTNFGKGPKLELNVLTYQMCVLMFWNNVDRSSDIEIEQTTGIFATYLEASNPWTPKELFVFEPLFFKVGKCCALTVLGNLTTLMNDDRFDSGNNDNKIPFQNFLHSAKHRGKENTIFLCCKIQLIGSCGLRCYWEIRTQQCYSREVDNDTKQASQVWILEGNELSFQLHVVGATISYANKLRWQLVLEDLDGS
ncbi:hypothetical protein V6N11_017558 [Hibiscus sabdariffa]|uniref:Cullin family profile domain-containing protein n=1 Tax=Hibiscus sabdariffa TaxID=183260 RepID=A0ABR2TZ57_9ROSI